jgi:RNA polymerase sigma factor (TIGR02999 family)
VQVLVGRRGQTPDKGRIVLGMTQASQTTVTRLLGELQLGNMDAFSGLFPLIYGELRALAHRQRQRWHGDLTLNTTALVHEAYLKLVDQKRLGASSRLHFFAVAAKAMRHILCNYARDRRRQKRGGELQRMSIDELDAMPETISFSAEQAAMLMTLDAALRELEEMDRQLSDVVECRFFGGMSIEDTAAALCLSPATVKRHWALARSWLYRKMQDQ